MFNNALENVSEHYKKTQGIHICIEAGDRF